MKSTERGEVVFRDGHELSPFLQGNVGSPHSRNRKADRLTTTNATDQRDRHGRTALHNACAAGDLKSVRDLLSSGANPALQASHSLRTPLMEAVGSGHYHAVLYLCQLDAPPSPSRLAVFHDDLGEELRQLLQKGTRERRKGQRSRFLDQKDVEGNTPLHLACGVFVEEEERDEERNRQGARQRQQRQGLARRLEAPVKEADSIRVVLTLLCFGASTFARNKRGETPLSVVCGRRAPSSMAGEDPLSLYFLRLLYRAGAQLSPEQASAIVQRDEQLSRENELGEIPSAPRAPLLLAAEAGNKSAIRFLLQNSVPFSRGENGETVLHVAAAYAKVGVLRLLLGHEVERDRDVVATRWERERQKEIGRETVIRTAEDERDSGHQRSRDYNAASLLEARDKEGLTPLHIAALSGSREAAQVLLESGVKVDSKERARGRLHASERVGRGRTALHFACSAPEDRGIATLLLSFGADIDAEDDFGLTPLSYAVLRNCKVAETLLLFGADVHGLNARRHERSDAAKARDESFPRESIRRLSRREVSPIERCFSAMEGEEDFSDPCFLPYIPYWIASSAVLRMPIELRVHFSLFSPSLPKAAAMLLDRGAEISAIRVRALCRREGALVVDILKAFLRYRVLLVLFGWKQTQERNQSRQSTVEKWSVNERSNGATDLPKDVLCMALVTYAKVEHENIIDPDSSLL